MGWECRFEGRADNGKEGPAGREVAPADQPVDGAPGSPGEFTVSACTPPDIMAGLSLAWLRIALHAAELDYVNERREKAGERLLWLVALIEEVSAVGFLPHAPSAVAVPDGALHDELDAIRLRCNALLIQLAQGLDFYGYLPGHVPLTSLEVYNDFLNEMIAIGKDLEQEYEEHYLRQQQAQLLPSLVKKAASALEKNALLLEDQRQQLADEIEATQPEALKLLADLNELSAQVENADESFRSAVERRGRCGLSDILKATASVVSVGTGVGAVVGGVAGAWEVEEFVRKKKVRDSLSGRAKFLVKEIREVRGGLNEVKAGYETIKGYLQGGPDAAKLKLDTNEFEETLNGFKDLPEAREYGRLMRAFLETAKLRNEKVLHVDALTTRLLEVEIEIEQVALEVDRTRGQLAEAVNPVLAEQAAFLEHAVTRMRGEILRALVMERRAMRYWSVRDLDPLRLEDRSLAHLQDVHAALIY